MGEIAEVPVRSFKAEAYSDGSYHLGTLGVFLQQHYRETEPTAHVYSESFDNGDGWPFHARADLTFDEAAQLVQHLRSVMAQAGAA